MINLECAKISRALKNEREAAVYSNEAGDFFMKTGETDKAIDIFKESIEDFKKNGNFDGAGKGLKKIGEYYESQYELELATVYYKQAADMFSLAPYKVTETEKLKTKVADVYSEMVDKPDQLKEAIAVG
jgi:tetratricopeptide (TPR) repeat protein